MNRFMTSNRSSGFVGLAFAESLFLAFGVLHGFWMSRVIESVPSVQSNMRSRLGVSIYYYRKGRFVYCLLSILLYHDRAKVELP